MGSIRQSFGVAAILGMALSSSVLAQEKMSPLDRMLIPETGGLADEVGHFPRGAPGTSTGSPIAYGANWGDVYVGAGFQSPIRYSGASDGGVAVGMGLGSSNKYVGVDVGLTALSTVRSGVGNRMALAVKVHKIFGENWGIAIGAENIYLNNKPVDGEASVYGVISKVMSLENTWFSDFRSLTLSAGAGNEGFRLDKDIRTGNKTIGAFGSAALRVWDQLAVIVDWPGQDLNVGLSIVPLRDFPLVLTPAINDITGSAGVHDVGTFHTANTVRPRFSLGAGLAFKF